MSFIGPKLCPQSLSRDDSAKSASPDGSPRANRTIGPCLPKDGYSTSVSHDKSKDLDSEISTDMILQPTPLLNSNTDEVQDSLQLKSQHGCQTGNKHHSSANHPEKSIVLNGDNLSNSVKPTTSSPMRRIFGAALPPAIRSEFVSNPIDSSLNSIDGDPSDSDSDDDYGPSLPPAQTPMENCSITTEETTKEKPYNSRTNAKSNSTSKLERAEWMLKPPDSLDLTSRIDPTKLKNRKFTSGRGIKRPADGSGVSAIWTETPEEKRKRLADEVLGREDATSASSLSRLAKSNPSQVSCNARISKEIMATKEKINEFNKLNRNKSLLEERKAAQDRGELELLEDDDPSHRAFDREKDMSLGGRHVNTANRKQFLMHAKNFGNRFQEGKYL
ncbi:hypothetical protein EV44_g1415 [Erysiphe necator]|uniref:DUF3752 domain-containing protein n=1 Tax=Uncinula necator TaxID=52586 RepID=A0A0B1P1X5_UNCNE|nr:hypothetical protein EV44_g1415 [Erysiphe necator]